MKSKQQIEEKLKEVELWRDEADILHDAISCGNRMEDIADYSFKTIECLPAAWRMGEDYWLGRWSGYNELYHALKWVIEDE